MQKYISVTPANNMVLKKKWDQNIFDIHRKKIRNAKPMIDNHPPATYGHLQINFKKLQMREYRRAIIERDNLRLLERMCSIAGRQVENPKFHPYKSLNKDLRQRTLIRVKNENQAILKRIQGKESHYNHLQWVDEWCNQNRYTSNVSKYPQNWINDVKIKKKNCKLPQVAAAKHS